jgi:hypothetical protein
MSMEIYLLTNDTVPSMETWQKAVDALQFDVRFEDHHELPGEIRLKAECQGQPVFMELSRVDLAYIRDTFPNVMFPDNVKHIHVLRWAMSFAGSAAAYQAAAAYLGLVKGLMIDTEEAKLKTPDAAIELAREMAERMPMLEAEIKKLFGKSAGKLRN